MPRAIPPLGHARIVLVVEDDPVQREAFVELLHVEGFEVLAAADGLQGERMAQAHRVDAAVLDIDLPQLDGVTLGRRLRRQLGDEAVLVVQSGRPLTHPRCLGSPFDAVFSKPVAPRQLIAALR